MGAVVLVTRHRPALHPAVCTQASSFIYTMTLSTKAPTDMYIFDLPDSFISSLSVIYLDESASVVESHPQPTNSPEPVAVSGTCPTCKVSFDLQGLRSELATHYKSDFHKNNLRRTLAGQEALSEAQFEELIETQSLDSISGSEESDSDDDYASALSLNMAKLAVVDEDEAYVSYMNTHSPYVLFKSPSLAENMAFGAFKAMFDKKTLDLGDFHGYFSGLTSQATRSGTSVCLMIGGGHFAGAVVSHKRKNVHGNAPGKTSLDEQTVEVLASKTFHRYTTRKKQGGSQSASDNANGKANSAGSSIRRYNEQALQAEVRELLKLWSSYIENASFVFIRASGVASRKVLMDYEGCVIRASDPRVKGFPFTTKRATLSEVKKSWAKVTRMAEVKMPTKKANAGGRKSPETATKENVKENEEPQLLQADRDTKEVVGLLRKSKAPMLIKFLRSQELDVNFRFSPSFQYVNTPNALFYAASQGLHHMVKVLLVNLHADATLQNDFGKTACQVAANTATRNAFQLSRHILGEDSLDWNAARVGPAKLSEEFAKEEEDQKREKSAATKKLIEEELAKKTELELKKPTVPSGGSTLGGAPPSVLSLSGLTEQQKMRLMREQRARAAEARFKRS